MIKVEKVGLRKCVGGDQGFRERNFSLLKKRPFSVEIDVSLPRSILRRAPCVVKSLAFKGKEKKKGRAWRKKNRKRKEKKLEKEKRKEKKKNRRKEGGKREPDEK